MAALCTIGRTFPILKDDVGHSLSLVEQEALTSCLLTLSGG